MEVLRQLSDMSHVTLYLKNVRGDRPNERYRLFFFLLLFLLLKELTAQGKEATRRDASIYGFGLFLFLLFL